MSAIDDNDAKTVFDCWHCGDGDALRPDESCAWCGATGGDETMDYELADAKGRPNVKR